MKTMIATCVLALSMACVAPGPAQIPTEGAFRNQVQRVVTRHDAYVQADAALTPAQQTQYLAQSGMALTLVNSGPKISVLAIAGPLAPVLDRYDAYVQVDASLDPLARDTYFATSSGLRSLLSELSVQ